MQIYHLHGFYIQGGGICYLNLQGMNKTIYYINDDFEGFQALISLWDLFRSSQYSDIEIQLSRFFSANMSAPLGAILDLLGTKNNISLKADSNIQTILQKNGFLSYHGYPAVRDNNNTTIQYMRFKRNENAAFAEYVSNKLLNRPELPDFTPSAKKKILQVILEIFVNATYHTKTEYIYTCGQFYPNKQCIDFSIVDTGTGIRNTVNNRLGAKKHAVEAIEWALIDGNTTKEGVPGGYGLTLLQEFLHYNKGSLQIISNDGYYCNENKYKKFRVFSTEFPGTVLNLQIKTDDTNLYRLKHE
ncbi:hypothetical protein [uncultured Dubosiella sp.]|uniref:hypothetical protein n=1 Tax=uncultured Dubosiella sp. TaxID=1937011 RepID=UPI00272A5660|nr:hypothetical protein [uncultured Dubosiella sp.]